MGRQEFLPPTSLIGVPPVILHQAEEGMDSPTPPPGLLMALFLITYPELESNAQPL